MKKIILLLLAHVSCAATMEHNPSSKFESSSDICQYSYFMNQLFTTNTTLALTDYVGGQSHTSSDNEPQICTVLKKFIPTDDTPDEKLQEIITRLKKLHKEFSDCQEAVTEQTHQ